MSLHTTLLTKLFVKSVGRLQLCAFVNFSTPWDLVHASDRLIDSRRFIDENSRNSDS